MTTLSLPLFLSLSLSSASLHWPCLHTLTHNPILQCKPRSHSKLHRSRTRDRAVLGQSEINTRIGIQPEMLPKTIGLRGKNQPQASRAADKPMKCDYRSAPMAQTANEQMLKCDCWGLSTIPCYTVCLLFLNRAARFARKKKGSILPDGCCVISVCFPISEGQFPVY